MTVVCAACKMPDPPIDHFEDCPNMHKVDGNWRPIDVKVLVGEVALSNADLGTTEQAGLGAFA